MKGAFREDHAVKSAVDNVPHGSGKNEGDAEHQTERFIFSGDFNQVPAYGNHSNDPENTQGDLSELTSELHTKGHPFIFREMKDEPVTQHGDLTACANQHIGFDPELENLISDQNQNNDNNCFFQFRD